MNKISSILGKKEVCSPSHKLSAECFTNCAKWKLNSTLTINKTSTGLVRNIQIIIFNFLDFSRKRFLFQKITIKYFK
jgi:hypothetical protein